MACLYHHLTYPTSFKGQVDVYRNSGLIFKPMPGHLGAEGPRAVNPPCVSPQRQPRSGGDRWAAGRTDPGPPATAGEWTAAGPTDPRLYHSTSAALWGYRQPTISLAYGAGRPGGLGPTQVRLERLPQAWVQERALALRASPGSAFTHWHWTRCITSLSPSFTCKRRGKVQFQNC